MSGLSQTEAVGLLNDLVTAKKLRLDAEEWQLVWDRVFRFLADREAVQQAPTAEPGTYWTEVDYQRMRVERDKALAAGKSATADLGARVAGVLAQHADCEMNAAIDNAGAALTNVDAWSCGITLPYNPDLDDSERRHLATAVAALLAPTDAPMPYACVRCGNQREPVCPRCGARCFPTDAPRDESAGGSS